MALPPPVPTLTADDYLRWEAEQPEKHEYVRGKRWELHEIEPEQPLQLQCLEVEISRQKVFRNVD